MEGELRGLKSHALSRLAEVGSWGVLLAMGRGANMPGVALGLKQRGAHRTSTKEAVGQSLRRKEEDRIGQREPGLPYNCSRASSGSPGGLWSWAGPSRVSGSRLRVGSCTPEHWLPPGQG